MGQTASVLTAAALAVSVLMSACAPHTSHRFIRRSGSGPIEVMEHPTPKPRLAAASSALRTQPGVRAAKSSGAPTVESLHPELRDALGALRKVDTPAAHMRVALAYYQVKVLDVALEHFDLALTVDARLAAAYDGRARIWRDWGLLGPAVADASRAVYFAPRSAAVRNTFGTVLEALGDRGAAIATYRCAASLDPGAAFARANLARFGDVTGPLPGDCNRRGAGAPGAPAPAIPHPRRVESKPRPS